MAAGGDDFLTKPIQRAELLARVEALLRVRHLNRDLDRALAYLHEMQAGGPDEPPMERPAAPPPEAAAAVILVADRDPVARKLYADLFRGAGCVIHEAREGSEALQIAQQKPIDVVLLDVMMPDMSGLDVLANLGEFIPDSPVILIAGEPSPEHTLAALRLGAFDFLVKGVTGEAITATVSRALERRRHAIRNRRLIQQAETKARELLAVLRQQAEESGRIPHQ